jgi:Protein of unknown function (DUF3373)
VVKKKDEAKMKKNALIAFAISALAFTPKAFSEGNTLLDRISELEANQNLNIFKISGSLTSRHDLLTYQNNPSTSVPGSDYEVMNYDRLRLDMNFDANLSERLNFYSTTTVSKFWNQVTNQNDDTFNTFTDFKNLGAGASYRDSGLVIAKAYFDYSFASLPMSLSAGRLPTYDGPPTHLSTGRARMGTYPRLGFNAILDGAGLSYKLDSFLPEEQKLVVRFVYSPLSFVNRGAGGYPTLQPTDQGGTERLSSQAPITAYMVDYSAKSRWWKELSLIAQYVSSRPLHEPDFVTQQYVPSGPGQGTFVSVPLLSNASFFLTRMALYAGVEDLLHMGLDLSASYLQTHIGASGQYTQGPGGPQLGSFFLDPGQDSGTVDGGLLLLSARYRLPISSLRRPFVGFEYVNGSSGVVTTDYMADDLTGFYANNGIGYHAYYIQPFDDNFSLRVGYSTQHTISYVPASYLGAMGSCDQTYTTGYAALRLDL